MNDRDRLAADLAANALVVSPAHDVLADRLIALGWTRDTHENRLCDSCRKLYGFEPLAREHGYTCGLCQWGRADQPRNLVDYVAHMNAEHPTGPLVEGLPAPRLDEERLARIFAAKRWMLVDLDKMARYGLPEPDPKWYRAIAAAIAKVYREDTE